MSWTAAKWINIWTSVPYIPVRGINSLKMLHLAHEAFLVSSENVRFHFFCTVLPGSCLINLHLTSLFIVGWAYCNKSRRTFWGMSHILRVSISHFHKTLQTFTDSTNNVTSASFLFLSSADCSDHSSFTEAWHYSLLANSAPPPHPTHTHTSITCSSTVHYFLDVFLHFEHL